ncbi:UbiX family flavin prenyltransferase [Pandoraea sp.]|uniref:UbiX family flavin prenyltransferase n=1 Tax=Pandoraea sp. TaxID=1883445 RepID=UPI00120D5614|nr:UbiX family flavin prenyltransferase [Pandoraea sp.]TAL52191.1 MAG: UbiX family flavin prenyltransferase [Pandoraea sp.]TAM17260.1 MAG: UbiX family flavin prenyltransferase [Pandoraea sp.]
MTTPRKIIVGITGASGAVLGVRFLQALARLDGVESHVIVSSSGALTAAQELGIKRSDIEALADVAYSARDIGAAVASGSFLTAGMVVVPCSMKTLAGIANGLADNLIGRAADVMLKERRRLVLVARETPLNLAHLRNMAAVTEMGAIVMPPVPAFYTRPQSVDDIVNHTVGRLLDLLGLEHAELPRRWAGLSDSLARLPEA